jgi:hypothetical protein
MSRWIARILLFATVAFQAGGLAFAQTPALDDLLAKAHELTEEKKYAEAAVVAEEALRTAERAFGKHHPELLKPLQELAQLYELQSRFADAETQYRRALAILKKSRAAEHSDLAETMNNLAEVIRKQGREEEANRFTELADDEEARAYRSRRGYGWGGGFRRGRRSFSWDDSRSPDARASQSPNRVESSEKVLASPPQLLPLFPWPPPASSASYVFPPTVFAQLPTVGQVTSAILAALERSGYVERSFFQTEPGGVALVTRLEKIGDDGTPAAGSDRWPLGFKSNPADLVSFLRGLFFVSPGHYRVIVFILQDLPFTQSSKEVSGEDAKAWLREGANTLPREIAGRPFGNGTCTALIYEFESDGSAAKIVESSVTGKQHLEKAGLLAALDSAN